MGAVATLRIHRRIKTVALPQQLRLIFLYNHKKMPIVFSMPSIQKKSRKNSRDFSYEKTILRAEDIDLIQMKIILSGRKRVIKTNILFKILFKKMFFPPHD